MFDGQFHKALSYARRLESQLDEKSLAAYFNLDYLEAYRSITPHVLIRFGRWKDILQEPLFDDNHLFATTNATLRYARGLAYAALGDVDNAENEQKQFKQLLQNPSLRKRLLHVNFMVTQDDGTLGILAVAEAMLAGELEYRKGNFEAAFAALREAVTLDDSLHYDEPWGWMVPARHALGALLFEQGRVSEAIEVYKADLQKNVENLWSLQGLSACYRQLGDNTLAEELLGRAQQASKRADIPILASCFCAVVTGAAQPTCAKCSKM